MKQGQNTVLKEQRAQARVLWQERPLSEQGPAKAARLRGKSGPRAVGAGWTGGSEPMPVS